MIRHLLHLARNQRGGSAVEFALLAPVFIALMMGVVEVGVYMQNYSAVRALATDASRFAAVEYQKNNKITEGTLESNIRSMGIAFGAFRCTEDGRKDESGKGGRS